MKFEEERCTLKRLKLKANASLMKIHIHSVLMEAFLSLHNLHEQAAAKASKALQTLPITKYQLNAHEKSIKAFSEINF